MSQTHLTTDYLGVATLGLERVHGEDREARHGLSPGPRPPVLTGVVPDLEKVRFWLCLGNGSHIVWTLDTWPKNIDKKVCPVSISLLQ